MADTDLSRNPLLIDSQLPFGAFPFDHLKNSHFMPALNESLSVTRKNLDVIRRDHDQQVSVNFENTILALETASEKLSRVSSIFFNLLGTNSDDELQQMAREISAKMADYSSDLLLDAKIFARVKSVWDLREQLGLQAEELKLTEKTYKEFVRNGGLLGTKEKENLREVDRELATLSPEFSDHVLKATNDFKLFLEDKSQLAGLPESAIEAAAEAAKGAGREGTWLFTLHAPSYLPFMTHSSVRELREKFWRASASRAFRDKSDNEKIAIRIAQLRHERATILGYSSHAAFVLEERMAETPEAVNRFLDSMIRKASGAAKRDLDRVSELRSQDPDSGGGEIMPWDFLYYSEKLKMKVYDLDQELLRPYFKLEDVVAGVFAIAKRLYNLEFKAVPNVPVSHPDIKTYEVSDASQGRHIGLFYADFFPRDSKRGGAWMSSFRDQGLQGGKVERPHITIVCNFTQPTPTQPSLLTFEEVKTLFHEFGHALHGLLSDCHYVSLAGTSVYWDFVELPSQIMENWASQKEALDLFAKHYQTGEKIPQPLVQRIRDAEKFLAGYSAMRQMQFAALDMAWHSSDLKNVTDIAEFEKNVTDRVRLLPYIEGTNSSCSFSHIFNGGYSAGYYSYKWAEVLDADAFELFKEKGIFNGEVARRFRDNILSRGGTEPPMELYKKFRGREPDPDALLRRDGLIDQ